MRRFLRWICGGSVSKKCGYVQVFFREKSMLDLRILPILCTLFEFAPTYCLMGGRGY